jgi:hypothetical protein
MTFVGAAGVLALRPVHAAFPAHPTPQLPKPRSSPNAPHPNVPSGLNDEGGKTDTTSTLSLSVVEKKPSKIEKLAKG